jgi:hypothetical protein
MKLNDIRISSVVHAPILFLKLEESGIRDAVVFRSGCPRYGGKY